MKIKFLLFYVLLSLNMVWGQSAKFTINTNSYEVSKETKSTTIDASWRLGRLQIVFKAPSINRTGKFDSLTLETVGRELDKYPIGFEAQQIVDKTGEENGCGSISVSYEGNRDRIAKSSVIDSGGSITLTKIDRNKVSGIFEGNIDGTKVSGTFENIEVKSW